MKRVVVVGGGFCGVVTAVNLARLTDAPLAVSVLNTAHPLGRGVAYGTRRPEHLLNVVARNMSALADQPDHFVEWLGTRSDFAGVPVAELREQFVPRRVYGDYLQALLLRHRGNISRAASEAGIDRNYIHRLVKKYGLEVDRG